PGPGGWAWASSPDHHDSGGEDATTNNRMELMAVFEAIGANAGPLVVVMDSTYVKDGLEKWSKAWRRNGWKTKANQAVKNRDLWEPLVDLADARRDEVTFDWVRGHSGDPMNDLADALAVERRDEFRLGGPAAPAGSGGGARLRPLVAGDQRDERRRRDPRIPDGHLLVVLGQRPPEVTGEVAEHLRDRLRQLFAAHAALREDLVVLTGLREGTERVAAEAAIGADVPYVVVLPFPDPHLRSGATDRARFQDLLSRATASVTLERRQPADTRAFAAAMGRRDAWLARAADEAILVWDEQDERFAKLHRGLEDHLGADLVVLHP
ncbi:MAG: ribonuclease H family protein, partial [Acidimicrobiales bacterium]